MVIVGIAIALLVIGGIVLGYAAASSGQRPVEVPRDSPVDGCKSACAQLLAARGTLCAAEAEAVRARVKAEAAVATHTATLIAAIAATAAAAAAWALTLVPIIGLAGVPVAIALTAIAVALAAVEAAALTALMAAQDYAARAAGTVSTPRMQ